MKRLALMMMLLLLMTQAGALAQSSNAVNPRDYAAFKIVPERNIFNPNRSARGPGIPRTDQEKPVKVDAFSLLGTMSYEKGQYAFFDGSSGDFHKVVSPANMIGGFTLKEIHPNRVKLEKDGKEFELEVGQQMKRQDEGEWKVSSESFVGQTSSTSNSPSGSSTGSSSSFGGSESDILKRLREKREKGE